ncbi:MAG: vanadium-dependent haloperoxidase [Pseudonocardiaceae bacterium]
MIDRYDTGRMIRAAAANRAYSGALPDQLTNGEETSYPYLASFSKGLPHDDLGEVDPLAYRTMLRALSSGQPEDFERIPLGVANGRRLLNLQGGFAFDLQGPDTHGTTIRPAPRIDEPENSAEMAELYWMALMRDVKFTDFGNSTLAADAADDLSTYSDFRAPKENGCVTPRTLFRAYTPGDLVGPYVSQFLLQDVQAGTMRLTQRYDTVEAGVDFMTDFDEWLAVQRGAPRTTNRDFVNTRYLQTPRDMAHYTHFDFTYQAYLNACLILLGMGAASPDVLDQGHPYLNSQNQTGFGTFGGPHILGLVAEVAQRAIKVTLYQQFAVHRRLRPEAFGARIDVHLTRDPGRYEGIIDSEILDSDVLKRMKDQCGSYLLPQSFPEGSPMSPAYHSGHSCVAGACVTILKAWFNESYRIPNPVVPNSAGTALVPYTGPDKDRLTVGGELNKLAANIGNGRNMGGVHWRSDWAEAFTLGEALAIHILRDQKPTTLENATLTLSRFDGTTIRI